MSLIHDDHPDLAALIGEGRVVAYFGYGSLVNRRTLRTRFLGIRRAEATGWRRFWLPRPQPVPALLSVRPTDGFVIQGVIVYDLADHLPLVDEREAGYMRRVVTADRIVVENPVAGDVPLFIYEASADEETASQAGAFILQSYLDAVMQGFHALYGRKGLERFVEETEGFHTAVLQDRHAPRYPRPVELEEGEAALFDALVSARGATHLPLA